ncbi:hypothetical protein QYE76_049148 [Lolium multiflorum]|uniref:Uncharacterized protein n=1 Tax=Lolium multiflorum TaxID=4521 RepID=A0AAD8SNR9_LOLMU|nr:hypothetical protein QYE76_049148 [Lolium multiflorum]
MATPHPAGADPADIPANHAPPRAPSEPTDAAQRLQRVRANLRLPDRPFAALSRDHDAGLRALRLLDFARLDLPSSGVPRPDLVAELVANYSPTRGRSSVRGERIEVSVDSLARALSLPPHAAPASSDADKADRASASREFARVYIGDPAAASTGMKRRLPRVLFQRKKQDQDYMVELFWELLKQEMEHLIESESTDCVSYYGAFLQRLIWVQTPELFQPAPEQPAEAVAPLALCVWKEPESNLAALCVRKEQGSNPAPLSVPKEQESNLAALCVWKAQESNLPTIHENHECCSESDICRAEASPKQVDMASKTTWSAVSDKGYVLTESLQDNSVLRKTASVSRRRRALSFEGADVADEVQALPPVVAAAPSSVQHKKRRGRPAKAQTALVEPGNRSHWKVQTAPVEPESRSPCEVQTSPVEPGSRGPCEVQIASVEPGNRGPCKVQTAPVEPENRGPCKVQTALVEPENRRVTRGSIKSNGSKPTPVVDQQANPKKKLGAKMMLKKQTPARLQGTIIKQMKRRK